MRSSPPFETLALPYLRRVPRSVVCVGEAGPFFKIVERIDGKLRTLFKSYPSGWGSGKTRELPIGPLLEAEIKKVTDGGKGTPYYSGWHVLPTQESCHQYLTKFKNTETKAVVACNVIGELWPKKHSREEVYLAEVIRITRIVEVIGEDSN